MRKRERENRALARPRTFRNFPLSLAEYPADTRRALTATCACVDTSAPMPLILSAWAGSPPAATANRFPPDTRRNFTAGLTVRAGGAFRRESAP